MTVLPHSDFMSWVEQFQILCPKFEQITLPQFSHCDPVDCRFNYPSHNPVEINRSIETARQFLDLFRNLHLTIQRLQSQVVACGSNLQKYISVQRSLIAPIRNLPTELLDEIMVLGLTEKRAALQSSWDRYRRREFAVVASHVCSVWRSCAIQSPRLWNDIQVPVFPARSSVNRIVDYLKVFLSRSHPLEIAAYIPLPDPRLEVNGLNSTAPQIISTLFEAAEKVKSLHVPSTFFYAAPFPHVLLPALRFLYLGPSDGISAVPLMTPHAASLLLNAPQLRGLRLGDGCSFPPALQFPWSQLHHLHLDADVFFLKVLPITRTFPQLTSIQLWKSVQNAQLPATLTAVRLPVRSLQVQDVATVQYLRTEHLTSFSVTKKACTSLRDFREAQAIQNLLIIPSACGASLTKLVMNLSMSRLQAQDVIHLLDLVFNLQTLHIRWDWDCYFRDDSGDLGLRLLTEQISHIFQAMVLDGTRPPLVPQLEHLTFTLNSPKILASDMFMVMIRFRALETTTFCRLDLNMEEKSDDDVKQMEFRECVEEIEAELLPLAVSTGLELHITAY